MISMHNKKTVLINIGIFAAIIVGYISVTLLTTETPPKLLSFENVGLQVPLKPLNGDLSKTVTLKDFRGQNLLVHFWASWCDACALDHKAMAQIAESYQSNSSIKIIGIASSDTQSAIDQSGMLKNSPYPEFLEESGNLALAMGVKTLPQTLLIDAEGHVLIHLQRQIDPHQVESIENKINSLTMDRVPPFHFESSRGKEVSLETLKQKIWVADFMFTSCPDMCPMLTSKMHLLQEAFSKDDRVNLVSVTVDPDTDTPAALQTYEKKYQVNPDRWFFLRGKMDAVTNLLVKGFKLGTFEEPEFHTGKFILVDQNQKIQGYYDADSSQSFEKLKSDIQSLLNK